MAFRLTSEADNLRELLDWGDVENLLTQHDEYSLGDGTVVVVRDEYSLGDGTVVVVRGEGPLPRTWSVHLRVPPVSPGEGCTLVRNSRAFRELSDALRRGLELMNELDDEAELSGSDKTCQG